MNANKNRIRIFFNALALSLTPVSLAMASGGRVDNSGFFVWIFLGFCALIIVSQIIPALLMAVGIVKGVNSKSKKVAQNVAK
jgi:hypothetical protein